MIRQPPQARGMFTDYTPNRGYDEYFSANDQPRLALRPLLSSLGRVGLAAGARHLNPVAREGGGKRTASVLADAGNSATLAATARHGIATGLDQCTHTAPH